MVGHPFLVIALTIKEDVLPFYYLNLFTQNIVRHPGTCLTRASERLGRAGTSSIRASGRLARAGTSSTRAAGCLARAGTSSTRAPDHLLKHKSIKLYLHSITS